MDFSNDEWNDFIEHCGFTDEELEIISYIRKGWYGVTIAPYLHMHYSTFKRKKDKIKKKISRRIGIR